jgi:DNA-directed RNA polymerase beta subunit
MAKKLLDDIAGDPVPSLGETITGTPTPTALTPVEPPVTHRAFGDSKTMRDGIHANIMTALKTRYPIENTRYSLGLENLSHESKPYSLEDQKHAIIRGRSLDTLVHGDWVLKDKATGTEVDRKKGVVAHIPYATDRGTFIYQGNEYTVANQMRLKPGVYTRVKENGIIEAHVNTKQGTGPSFRIYMEPDTGIFRLGVGQSTLKLYPVLRAMGASDKEIGHHWGDDLLQKNIAAEDPRAVARAFAKLVATRADLATAETNAPLQDGIEKEAASYEPDFSLEASQ